MTLNRLATVLTDFWALRPEVKVTLLQTLLIAVAGAWAFHLYRKRREGRSTMRLDGACRIVRQEDHRLLFLRLHLSNNAAVVLRNVQADVTLLGVTAGPNSAPPSYRVLHEDDPLLVATSELKRGGERVAFVPGSSDLEPNECIQTEVVVRIPADVRLIAARLTAQGSEGRSIFRREPQWAWLAYIHPEREHDDYVPLSIHHGQ
jgi:hypothetical protein